jgi:hypothetical protein
MRFQRPESIGAGQEKQPAAPEQPAQRRHVRIRVGDVFNYMESRYHVETGCLVAGQRRRIPTQNSNAWLAPDSEHRQVSCHWVKLHPDQFRGACMAQCQEESGHATAGVQEPHTVELGIPGKQAHERIEMADIGVFPPTPRPEWPARKGCQMGPDHGEVPG